MKRTVLTILLGLSLFCGQAFADGMIISDVVKDGVRIVHYRPDERVCSSDMEIHIKGGKVEFYRSTNGCSGNGRGIGALVKGMTIDEAIERLDGIPCGKRPTSCPDQLAQALKAIKKKGNKK